MQPSDKDIAQVVYDTYWAVDKLTRTLEVDDVFVGIQDTPEYGIICFRGSTTPMDWVRDFQAQMVYYPDLGGVEFGFIQGLRKIIGDRRGVTPGKPVYVTGHSLGAARACIFAAMEKLAGFEVAGLTVFGCPRPGAAKLKALLSTISVKSYRNCNDPVCEVPLDIPLLDPYEDVRPFIELNAEPPENDPWGPFAAHHFELYQKGLDALAGA